MDRGGLKTQSRVIQARPPRSHTHTHTHTYCARSGSGQGAQQQVSGLGLGFIRRKWHHATFDLV
jgi:hypothetical protein